MRRYAFLAVFCAVACVSSADDTVWTSAAWKVPGPDGIAWFAMDRDRKPRTDPVPQPLRTLGPGHQFDVDYDFGILRENSVVRFCPSTGILFFEAIDASRLDIIVDVLSEYLIDAPEEWEFVFALDRHDASGSGVKHATRRVIRTVRGNETRFTRKSGETVLEDIQFETSQAWTKPGDATHLNIAAKIRDGEDTLDISAITSVRSGAPGEVLIGAATVSNGDRLELLCSGRHLKRDHIQAIRDGIVRLPPETVQVISDELAGTLWKDRSGATDAELYFIPGLHSGLIEWHDVSDFIARVQPGVLGEGTLDLKEPLKRISAPLENGDIALFGPSSGLLYLRAPESIREVFHHWSGGWSDDFVAEEAGGSQWLIRILSGTGVGEETLAPVQILRTARDRPGRLSSESGSDPPAKTEILFAPGASSAAWLQFDIADAFVGKERWSLQLETVIENTGVPVPMISGWSGGEEGKSCLFLMVGPEEDFGKQAVSNPDRRARTLEQIEEALRESSTESGGNSR